MHLAAAQPHRHVAQGDDAAEVLGDVLELEDVLGLGIRRHRYLASVTRLRTWLLKSTAISSIAPRNTRNQSEFTFV